MSAEADLKPVYLIVSEQKMLVDEALERLKKRVAATGDLDFNMQVFEGESASGDDIVVASNTLPFAAEYRLVIVRGLDKLSKEASDRLCEYAADPSPTAILALAGEKLAKNTRLYRAVEKVGDVLDRRVEKRDFPTHVRKMFQARGRTVTTDAAEELVAAVGYDLHHLSIEVDKAVAFAGERKEIVAEDIESVISTTAPTAIWEFTEAIGERNCRKALSKASDLIDEGESVFGLHAMALRTLRDLMTVRALLDRGVTAPYEISAQLGRQEWLAKRLINQAKRFRAEELVDLLKEAAKGEALMKTGRDPRLVLERWIVKACVS